VADPVVIVLDDVERRAELVDEEVAMRTGERSVVSIPVEERLDRGGRLDRVAGRDRLLVRDPSDAVTAILGDREVLVVDDVEVVASIEPLGERTD
jgi:hypothetical protein